MAELQKFKPPSGATFAIVADKLFAALTSNPSKQVDVVFDVYKDISIKNIERSKRATGTKGVTYQNILPGYNVKNWNKILSVAANKAEVVRFLVGQWKEKRFRDKLNDRILYVTEEEKCWKISMMAVTLVPDAQVQPRRGRYALTLTCTARGKKVRTPRGRYRCAGAASWPRPQPRQVLLKEREGSKE